jgi:signal-transduction protein with cAMP-binding, CBS, and nucleotidyltransferase domain
VQSVKKEQKFYKYFSPDLKNQIIFTLLDSYYQKFFFFFNDVETQNFADPFFIRKILSLMDCAIFIEGTCILEYGKRCTDLYFIYKGGVTMIDVTFTLQIAVLPEESFFGDY